MLVFTVGRVQVSEINVSITAVPVMDGRCFAHSQVNAPPAGHRRTTDFKVREQLHSRFWLQASLIPNQLKLVINNILKLMLMPAAPVKMFCFLQ